MTRALSTVPRTQAPAEENTGRCGQTGALEDKESKWHRFSPKMGMKRETKRRADTLPGQSLAEVLGVKWRLVTGRGSLWTPCEWTFGGR